MQFHAPGVARAWSDNPNVERAVVDVPVTVSAGCYRREVELAIGSG